MKVKTGICGLVLVLSSCANFNLPFHAEPKVERVKSPYIWWASKTEEPYESLDLEISTVKGPEERLALKAYLKTGRDTDLFRWSNTANREPVYGNSTVEASYRSAIFLKD